VTKNEGFSVEGNVTDEKGNPLYNVQVKIHINSIESNPIGSGTTGADGEFQISCLISSLTIQVSVGENLLIGNASQLITSTLIFNNSITLNNPLQPNATVFVHSPTKLKFIRLEDRVPEGYLLDVQAKLTDISGLPLPNRNLSIVFDGNTVIATNKTNNSGIMFHRFPLNVTTGAHDLAIHFYGEQYLEASKVNYTIFVQSDKTDIFIYVNTYSVTVNDKIWVNGTIMGINDEPINARLNITFSPVGSDEKFVKVTTAENGEFYEDVFLPAIDFHRGDYEVYVFFPGSEKYSKDTSNSHIIFVKGLTNFKYKEMTVYRGSPPVYVRVNLTDHQNQPLAGRQIRVRYSLPSLAGGQYDAWLVTDIDGIFSIPFKARLSDPLGAVNINISFNGSSYYQGITTDIRVLIKSITTITIREFPDVMVRNKGYMVRGLILDDQLNGVPEQTINVYLGSDENYWEIYPVTTDKTGNFSLSILVPTSFPLGVQPMEFSLIENDKYDSTSFGDNIIIFSKPFFKLQVNGTIKRGGLYTLNLTLMEDNGKIPIPKSIITVYFDNVSEPQFITNEEGNVKIVKTFPQYSNKVKIKAVYDGLTQEYYIGAEDELVIKPTKVSRDNTFGLDLAQYGYIFIIIIAVFVSLYAIAWWRKKRFFRIGKMISDVISQLETSDKSRRIIYEAYVRLLRLLQALGLIRKESETPREFQKAVSKTLPHIDTPHLNSITTLFEEARYSEHRMGKGKRSRAVRNLKQIRTSLEPEPEKSR
jgi:hypothetical protein